MNHKHESYYNWSRTQLYLRILAVQESLMGCEVLASLTHTLTKCAKMKYGKRVRRSAVRRFFRASFGEARRDEVWEVQTRRQSTRLLSHAEVMTK